ncbi:MULTISPECIES: hypothetical protein, partial [unclassified Streptomyces]|uniref:hypothetical protein n=1 Tax=unclassified Streptomyces TaxID=2593676 RepID=UPI003321B047
EQLPQLIRDQMLSKTRHTNTTTNATKGNVVLSGWLGRRYEQRTAELRKLACSVHASCWIG